LGLPLQLLQPLGLGPLGPAEVFALLEVLDEPGHLRPEDLRHKRLDQVIDGTQVVRLADRQFVTLVGGEEDDGRVPRPRPAPDGFRSRMNCPDTVPGQYSRPAPCCHFTAPGRLTSFSNAQMASSASPAE